jgi:hypothetical protein
MTEKRLSRNRHASQQVALHDSGLKAGSLITQAMGRLSEDQARNLMSKAGEEALRLEVQKREQDMQYDLGRRTAEDHVEAFDMLNKNGRTTRQTVTSNIRTGAGNMRIESKSGATCFVASVAYDDPNHPDVMYLRWIRDNKLNHSQVGRKFVAWYWRNGPKLAEFVKKYPHLCSASRSCIGGFVILTRVLVGDQCRTGKKV